MNVPLGLIGIVAVLAYLRPDRPSKPTRMSVDWFALTIFVAWVVCLLFAFGWSRKWGGWSSNEFEFAVVVGLCLALPLVLLVWLSSGYSPDEHLKRLLRNRVYLLAMMVRLLLLLNLATVTAIVGQYFIELRDEPRMVAGWVLFPAAITMSATTLPTTFCSPRRFRHAWLFVGVFGSSACLWWLSSLDNFTAKEHIAAILAWWGASLGLLPPVFLTDEVEGINPKDEIDAASLALVGIIVPHLTIPTMTSTVTKAWSDRALDVFREHLSENRPAVAVAVASLLVVDSCRQRGLTGADLQGATSRILGGYATVESVAVGFRQGFRFLGLVVLGLGLAIAIPLARSARNLKAPPGAGYS